MLPVCSRSRNKSPVGLNSRRTNNRLLVLLVTAIAFVWVSSLRAAPLGDQVGWFHPDLKRAIDELYASPRGERHVPLRRVWEKWDRAEPDQVEAALQLASRDERLVADEQAYAELLVAYARLRRGDAAGARSRVARLGYADRWLVLGPFDNTGKVGFETTLDPQQELLEPIVFGRPYSGKDGRLVRWRRAPESFPFGWVDAGALLRPSRSICAFFATHVTREGSRRGEQVSVWAGARGAYRLYWNGELALEDSAYRGHDFDRRAALVWLQPGPNRVTVEVCGEGAAPMLSVRVGDERGHPTAGLAWQAQGPLEAIERERSGLVGRAQLGPLARLEAAAAARPGSAARKQALAQYLAATEGDDPALHQARDAALAAAAEPTVERALLVAELAEDRNQQRQWIDRAERLLPSVPAARRLEALVEVLMAKAAWIESGVSSRLALPLYEQVLELEPDHVEALSGKVRLYELAGLRQSALVAIRDALRKNPHSVALLNLYYAELEGLGYTAAAARVRWLYSGLRFDDRTALLGALELSRERRDRSAVDHWTQRLLDVSPGSPWVYGVAAAAQRSVGRPRQALAMYERALTLAPEDSTTLQQLADLRGAEGQTGEQVALIRRIVGLEPQNEEVRRYLEALEPALSREDEALAWAPERFLEARFDPPRGYHQRTLLDLTVTQVFDSGAASRFRQVVFQPLSDAGAAVARQFAFAFQADRQRAQLRAARVYRTSGRVDEAIESGEGAADNPALSMYTSARTFYVQFPRLEPGDVVELRYRVDDVGDRHEWSGYFGEITQFQQDTPVGHGEYVVMTPTDRKLYVDAQGIDGLKTSVEEQAAWRVHRFWADGIPALVPEPDMPPWPEVIGFVHVSTYPSYKQLGQWYWGLSRDQLVLDEPTRRLLSRIVAGASTVREKVEAVYGWVVKSTRYVALEFGIEGYKPRPCTQTVARGWGDCKDKATVIVAMLAELGIEATTVLVRTGLRGRFQSDVASLSVFDHAIAYVPELDLYLDGTAEFTGTRELPAMDQGAFALQINRGDAQLVTLPGHDPEQHVKQRRIELWPKGEGARVELSFETRGASAPAWRHRYAAEATRQERVLSDLRHQYPDFTLAPGQGALTVNDLTDYEQPVRMRVEGELPRLGRQEGKSRSIAVLPPVALVANHARLATRRTDLMLEAPATLDDTFVVHLLATQSVVSLPQAVEHDSPFGRYRVATRRSGDTITVESRLELKRTRIPPGQYAAFRSFCEQVDQIFAAKLVLRDPR